MASPKWALVTGVSPGGMGEGEVIAFLNRGISVFATAIDQKLLEGIKLDKKHGAASMIGLELDVTSPESIAAAVEKVDATTGGKLDFLINNAGYGYYMPLLDVDIVKARKQYEVNVWGVLAVTQAFFPLLRAAKGTVVNQASMAGVQGFNRPYMSIYSSSKAAVYSMSDNMRVEFAPFDVKVFTLVTGSVKTEFFNHKEGGNTVTLPSTSVYQPIRQLIEPVLQASISSGKGSDRFKVTQSTINAVLRWPIFRTRYIRRGYLAVKLWLMHVLLPTWLLDRWARQSGGLDKLWKILNYKVTKADTT